MSPELTLLSSSLIMVKSAAVTAGSQSFCPTTPPGNSDRNGDGEPDRLIFGSKEDGADWLLIDIDANGDGVYIRVEHSNPIDWDSADKEMWITIGVIAPTAIADCYMNGCAVGKWTISVVLDSVGKVIKIVGTAVAGAKRVITSVDPTILDKINFIRNARIKSLSNELKQAGVNINPDIVIDARKVPDGNTIHGPNTTVWLDPGNETAGLQHIIDGRKSGFAAKGVSEAELPKFLLDSVQYGKVVGQEGTGINQRLIYELMYKGSLNRVAVGIANNGYIVTAIPKSIN